MLSRKTTAPTSASSIASCVQPINRRGDSSAEFPYSLLPLLRCTRDASPLILAAEFQSGTFGIIHGLLKCSSCPAEYPIQDGIVLLLHGSLSPEDRHEMAMRDSQSAQLPPAPFIPPSFGWRSLLSDLLEIPPHLHALQPRGCRVLEIGCGDGRLTLLLAQMGATVLAADFSINALRALAARLPSGLAPTAFQLPRPHSRGDLRHLVGLVHADASHFNVAPRSFDRALCTTPLDSREERMALYRTLSEALSDQGRYVGSVENDDLTRRLLGLPAARRYSSGIFIEHFTREKMRREAAPFFSKIHIQPIRPRIPFLDRLPFKPALFLSRITAALPLLRGFGEILLLRAEQPIRPPQEGVSRPGSKLLKRLYRWYMRTIGKPAVWEENEPV